MYYADSCQPQKRSHPFAEGNLPRNGVVMSMVHTHVVYMRLSEVIPTRPRVLVFRHQLGAVSHAQDSCAYAYLGIRMNNCGILIPLEPSKDFLFFPGYATTCL